MSSAQAGGPFPPTPIECIGPDGINAAAIAIAAPDKRSSDPAVDVTVEVFVTNNVDTKIACEAELSGFTVETNGEEICELIFDPPLTIESGETGLKVDGGECTFNTLDDLLNPTRPIDMKWVHVALLSSGDLIVKDGNDSEGNAGIARTTHEQAVTLSLTKVPTLDKVRVNADTNMATAQYTFEASFDSSKRFLAEVTNCRIEDNTFGTTVASGFNLSVGAENAQSFVREFTFPAVPEQKNDATLFCDDQFLAEQTAVADATVKTFTPEIEILKKVDDKYPVGAFPKFDISIVNKGNADLFGCVITDPKLGLTVPVTDDQDPPQPLVLEPGDTWPTDGTSIKGTSTEALVANQDHVNTARVDCLDQNGDDVDDTITVTVTPLSFEVNLEKECNTKIVNLPGTEVKDVDCNITIWKTAGTADLADCDVADDKSGHASKILLIDDDNDSKAKAIVITTSYSYTLEQVKDGEGFLTNKATIDCATQQDVRTGDEDSWTTEILFPNISVNKECVEEEVDGVKAITWSWTIENTSPDMMSLAVTSSGVSTQNNPEPEDAVTNVVLSFGDTITNTWTTFGAPGTYSDEITAVGIYQDDNSVMAKDDATCMIPDELKGGCTPGYWKGNFDNWEAVSWTAPFNAMDPDYTLAQAGFVTDKVDNSDTLREALSYKGGNFDKGGTERNLLRHGVANMLNAASSDVGSPLGDAAAVVAFVNAAIATQDATALQDAKNTLAAANEAGCTINQQGIPENSEVS
jgi:hypothetical protein